MKGDEEWHLPPLTGDLAAVVGELRGLARGGLEEEREDAEEVKGLKFISGKLARLFDRNRKLKYSYISRVLIDNFSSESNDSRNIKRRVYDAINVMVAAGLFIKSGDSLEKKEEDSFRERVEVIKGELSNQLAALQSSLAPRRKELASLTSRKQLLAQHFDRNKQEPGPTQIPSPIVVNPNSSSDNLLILHGEKRFRIALPRNRRRRGGKET
jgi:hypothetical protein